MIKWSSNEGTGNYDSWTIAQNGAPGAAGATGNSGSSGTAGATGNSGSSGTSGQDGQDGVGGGDPLASLGGELTGVNLVVSGILDSGTVRSTSNINFSLLTPHIIQDEGVGLPAMPALNFTGLGVTASNDDPATEIDIPGAHQIQFKDEDGTTTSLNQQRFLKVLGIQTYDSLPETATVIDGTLTYDFEIRNKRDAKLTISSDSNNDDFPDDAFILFKCGGLDKWAVGYDEDSGHADA